MPHRDWTRHGVGRALLWWPFMAFVAVAVFPAVAVLGVILTGACLIVVGLVGGAVGRRRRARRLREAARAVAPFAPRAVREGLSAAREARSASGTRSGGSSSDSDAEDDQRVELRGQAA